MQRLLCVVLLSISVVFSFTRLSPADDDEEAKKEASAKRLVAMKTEIEKFELTIIDDSTKRLVRVEEPVQRWNNPIVPIPDATVFLWTLDGRPAVIAQLAEVPTGELRLEAHSLTEHPLNCRFHLHRWAPKPPGVKWIKAPTDEAPAATADQRRIQMRKIAERYQISDFFEDTSHELRLLPKPLYRYSVPEAGIVDGALFSFVLGTDPEVILLVETQKEGKADTWKVAFARMTGYGCEAKLDDDVVWTCQLGFSYPESSPFFTPIDRFRRNRKSTSIQNCESNPVRPYFSWNSS